MATIKTVLFPRRKNLGPTLAWQAALALAVLSLPFMAPGQLLAQRNDIGFVLEISGDWFLDQQYSERVTLGQSLPRGAAIRIGPQISNARITVVLYNGDALSAVCSSSAGCRKILTLPSSIVPGPSRLERIMKAVGTLFQRHPERYFVSALSRGSGTGAEAHEAVIGMDDNQVNLDPVLSEVKDAQILLRFEKITPDTEGLSTIGEVWLTREGDRTRVQLDQLKPGLAIVSLLRPQDRRVISDAWVLFCTREQAKVYRAAFQQAEALSLKWKKESPAPEDHTRKDATRSFLRAYLEALSEAHPEH